MSFPIGVVSHRPFTRSRRNAKFSIVHSAAPFVGSPFPYAPMQYPLDSIYTLEFQFINCRPMLSCLSLLLSARPRNRPSRP